MKNSRVLSAGALAACFTFSLFNFYLPVEAENNYDYVVSNGGMTIDQALEEAEPGDSILIKKGDYYNDAAQFSVETEGIKIIGEPGAVLHGDGIKPNDGSLSMITVYESDVSISGLEITGLTLDKPDDEVAVVGITVEGKVNNVSISDCKIHDMGVIYNRKSEEYNGHGILVSGEVREPISNVTISGCELYNLTLGQSETVAINGDVDTFTVCNNYIHDCDNIGIDAIGYEKTHGKDGATQEKDRARNGKIYGNTVENIGSGKNPTYDDECAGGIYVDGGKSIEIYDNYVANCDIGVEVSAEYKGKTVSDINVHNNTFVNNNALAGISLGGCDPSENGSAENCQITNNTVYNTGHACLNLQYACSPTNKITNNIFVAEGDAAIVKSWYPDGASAGNTIENNAVNKSAKELGEGNIEFECSDVSVNGKTVEITSGALSNEYGASTTVLK